MCKSNADQAYRLQCYSTVVEHSYPRKNATPGRTARIDDLEQLVAREFVGEPIRTSALKFFIGRALCVSSGQLIQRLERKIKCLNEKCTASTLLYSVQYCTDRARVHEYTSTVQRAQKYRLYRKFTTVEFKWIKDNKDNTTQDN